jgi:hypothetical protein
LRDSLFDCFCQKNEKIPNSTQLATILSIYTDELMENIGNSLKKQNIKEKTISEIKKAVIDSL